MEFSIKVKIDFKGKGPRVRGFKGSSVWQSGSLSLEPLTPWPLGPSTSDSPLVIQSTVLECLNTVFSSRGIALNFNNLISMLKSHLEKLYRRYNSRKWVHPDPLEFLYDYPDVKDREIVALIGSSLAYGRVAQILKSVSSVLEKMGPHPRTFLDSAGPKKLNRTFAGFKHRFTTDEELIKMMRGIQRIIKRHGSLRECFLSPLNQDDETCIPALSSFVKDVNYPSNGQCNSLLPLPERGSACKRLHLFLRWMVRKDGVDPGGWDKAATEKLIVPLDTHMFRISTNLGFTRRKNPDMKTAIEITKGFRNLSPDDPVRYDFALTRLGIRNDEDRDDMLGTLYACK